MMTNVFYIMPVVNASDIVEDHLEQTEGTDSNFGTVLTTATTTEFHDAPNKVKRARVWSGEITTWYSDNTSLDSRRFSAYNIHFDFSLNAHSLLKADDSIEVVL